jgi:hypothetical protein
MQRHKRRIARAINWASKLTNQRQAIAGVEGDVFPQGRQNR